MGPIRGLNTALGTPQTTSLHSGISTTASPHSCVQQAGTNIISSLITIISHLRCSPFHTSITPTSNGNTWGLCWAALQGLALPLLIESFCLPGSRGDEKVYACMCARNTGPKWFRWHFINAVQPAPLNQHKTHREDEQDERSFILLQAAKSTQILPHGAWWSRKET